MRYWLYPQYYGGGKGPTLRGALWKWIKRVVRVGGLTKWLQPWCDGCDYNCPMQCEHPWARQDEIGRPYCAACGMAWSLVRRIANPVGSVK